MNTCNLCYWAKTENYLCVLVPGSLYQKAAFMGHDLGIFLQQKEQQWAIYPETGLTCNHAVGNSVNMSKTRVYFCFAG